MKTVLLADDEANLRTLVRTTLEGSEYRVVEAQHGRAALEMARTERPDVVVLDWMMPHLSGIDVLRALRGDPATASLPVIMLTARGQQADRAEALDAGTAVYLTKPFSPLELLEKVEEATRRVTDLAESAVQAQTEAAPDGDSASQLALYARDLSRMVEAERERARELAEANARLQRLDRLKVDFLTFISHELRTPLNHIAACDMYDQTMDPHDQAAIMRIVRNGYEWLDGFIRQGLTYFDWMAVERIESARPVELDALVRMVADEQLEGRRRLDLQTDGQGPYLVRAAADALATAVRALLANALKFSTAPARVQVSVQRADDGVVLRVQDLGCGFAPDLGDEIFRPFTVADALHHNRGTGLSLALTGAIVHAHGGRATAHSAGPGTGATFTITLPRLVPDAATDTERRS